MMGNVLRDNSRPQRRKLGSAVRKGVEFTFSSEFGTVWTVFNVGGLHVEMAGDRCSLQETQDP